MYWKELSNSEVQRWDKRLRRKYGRGLPSNDILNTMDSGVYQLRGRIFKWPHFICYSRTQDEYEPEHQNFRMYLRFCGKKEQLTLNFKSTSTTDTLARRIQSALASPGVESVLRAELPVATPDEVKITMHQMRNWLADCLTEVKQI